MFRRPPYRGSRRHDESKASNRHCRAVHATGERSLGRILLYVLRYVRRTSLVQYAVSVMKAKLLTGVAALVLHASAAHDCELEVKILKDNSLHVLEKCAGVETFHGHMKFYYPRGGPHDAAHECKLLKVEQIDQSGSLIHDYCEYRKGGRKATLVIQSTNDRILITNAENY